MTRPMIVTSYKGATNHRASRAMAHHRRDSEQTYCATVEWEHALSSLANHQAAALKLALKIGFYGGKVKVESVGHDHSHYYFTAVPA
jgi:hypothetical protein